MCDHQYQYAGVRFCNGSNPLPGSGATRRYYAHVYFCSKCTDTKGETIRDPGDDSGRYCWNSYMKPDFSATPGNPAQCGVPLHDQR